MNANAYGTMKVSKHRGMEVWKYVCKQNECVFFKNVLVKLKFNNSIKKNYNHI